MKFFQTLNAKYNELNLNKPQWLKEYTATPAITPATGQAIQNVASTVAGMTPAGGVVNALMKAMDMLQDDPEVQKIKANVTQKIADAKKQITNASKKTVDDIAKAVTNLQNSSKPSTTQSTTSNVGTI